MSDEEFSIKHPIVSYCFAIMEYVKKMNPELYARAEEYAEDLSGVRLGDFELSEVDEDTEYPPDITDQIEEGQDLPWNADEEDDGA